jgi:hypothetical protein
VAADRLKVVYFAASATCIDTLVAAPVFQPEGRQTHSGISFTPSAGQSWDRLTGDASASGHITPSFGGNTAAEIGADVGAGGAATAGILLGGGPAANVGLGGKNGGRNGRPAAPDWKGGVPAAGGATAGDPANGGKAPGGGGMNPGGGAKGGILKSSVSKPYQGGVV